MPTRNISLTDHLDAFVEAEVRSGRFNNASEVVRDALRSREQDQRAYEAKLAALNAAVQVGLDELDRGEVVDVSDLAAFFDALNAEVDALIEARERSSEAA